MFSYESLKKSGVLLWAAIFVFITLAVLVVRACNDKDPVTYTQAQVDSIVTEKIQPLKDTIAREREDSKRLAEIIKVREEEKNQAIAKADAAGNSAESWRKLYVQARENHDTVTMVYAADSMAQELLVFKEQYDSVIARVRRSDSAFIAQIDKLEIISNRQAQVISQQDLTIKILYEDITKHNIKDAKEVKRAKTRKFFRWVERVAIVAGTVFIMSKAN